MPLTLSYDDPVTAVFLRILAWELYVAKDQPRVQNLVTQQLPAARKELGLGPLAVAGGAGPTFIQGLRPKGFLSAKNMPPMPLQAEWQTEWRLLYLPPHNLVRQLSDRPVFVEVSSQAAGQVHKEYLLTLRDPAVPTLRVFVGTTTQPKAGTFNQRRGLYFLGLDKALYVGKTDQFDVRLSQQTRKKKPVWWVFVTPEDSAQMFTQDALSAAEALLISFWNETSVLENNQRGLVQKPAFVYLQQAILLVEAASATLLWLIRKQNNLALPQFNAPFDIPFKLWRGRGWPDCYKKVPGT